MELRSIASTQHTYLLQIHRWTETISTDGFDYSRKKPRDTPLYSAWRCRKNNPPTKCPCHAYLTLSDNSLTLGSKPHNHPVDNSALLKREVLSTLKRKAAEQPLSVTQNILSEVPADSTPETNQTLPSMESLARVVQRSRAAASGSALHTEATTPENFLLPPTCTSTRRDEPFVLYDGKTRKNVRVLAFSTTRNLATLAEYNKWIADGTFYVAPRIFAQSYIIHAVIDTSILKASENSYLVSIRCLHSTQPSKSSTESVFQ